MIPYSRQNISEDDIEAVIKVLKSEFLTNGPIVNQFEIACSHNFKVKYCTSMNSATSALHVACLSLGLKKNDIVWTTPNTFVASANCALYCGAKIDFVDINSETNLIDIQLLSKKLDKAEKANKLPKIIIPVHLTGQPTNQEDIYKLSKKYNFKIIEDASHSMGAIRNKEPVGTCKWSDITIFSFHPVKIITTGEGGMILTNNVDVNHKAKLFRTSGITREKSYFDNKNLGPWYYEQLVLGYNYKMTDIQAALGMSQLKRLDAFVNERNEIAKSYNDELINLPIKLPFIMKENYSSFHLYVIRLEIDKIKITHKEVHQKLIEKGISVNLHYFPVHLHPFYQKLGFKNGMFPESEKYAEQAISIPIFPGLSNIDQEYIIKTLRKILI